MIDLCDKVIQSLETIGEAAGKLYPNGLIAFEKEGKSELVRTLLLIILNGISVWYLSSTPAPLSHLSDLPIANLHSLIIEAGTLRKPLDHKLRLPLDALHAEIKPVGHPSRVGLLLKFYLVCVRSSHEDVAEVAAFEITSEDGRANRDYFTFTTCNLLYIFVDGLPVGTNHATPFLSFGQL